MSLHQYLYQFLSYIGDGAYLRVCRFCRFYHREIPSYPHIFFGVDML